MRKATGVVRPVDTLGRVVLPNELRKTLNIVPHDPMEVYVDGEEIILKKYIPGCAFCGNTENTVSYEDKNICKDCAERISGLFE